MTSDISSISEVITDEGLSADHLATIRSFNIKVTVANAVTEAL